jgi:hypothetical protein
VRKPAGADEAHAHVARQIRGIVFKDEPEDLRKFRAYLDHIAKARAKRSRAWSDFHAAAKKNLND